MALLDGLLKILPGKKTPKPGGTASTSTFRPTQKDQVLTAPQYTEFRTDLFNSRLSQNSQTLLNTLFVHDPDISAALNGYLTLANTAPTILAHTIDGMLDLEASRDAHAILLRLTSQVDYTQGFQFKQSFPQLCADLRYLLLLRGAIPVELMFDKAKNPEKLKQIDPISIRWFEKETGIYKPSQVVPGQSDTISLDIPTFFISFYRRNPTNIYTDSPFVSSINTIAARQQVINDLYRIMQVTGYPRMEITILEEVIRNNAPANIRSDEGKMVQYVNETVASIATTYSTLRVDDAVIHTDSQEVGIINDKNPGTAIDISAVVDTLNAQNQAALKTMATILGRGASGVNTGSVEARLAAMYADELNKPIGELFSKILSFILHQNGFQGFVSVQFKPAELRPDLELEPQRTLKAARLLQDLSLGIIDDAEYHLQMHQRLPSPDAPVLSGTQFMAPSQTAGGDNNANGPDVSSNTDPLGRSVSPDNTSQTKTNRKKVSAPVKNSIQGTTFELAQALALSLSERRDS